MQFKYSGFDKQGGQLSGTLQADNQQLALESLQNKGIMVSDIQPVRESAFKGFSQNKITLHDRVFLTQELALLLESGLRIDKGVELLARTAGKPALQKLLEDIHSQLKSGSKVSQAFAEHPDVFDALYINLLRIAEETGQLKEVFQGLTNDLIYRKELSNKIKQAISYPLVILVVCVMSLIFIFNVVVPNLSGMFREQENLPVYTQLLLDTSDFIINYQWYLFAGISAVVFGLISFAKHPVVNEALQKAALRLPLIKQAVIQTARIRFNDALSLMLHSGIVVDKALSMATDSIGNRYIRAELQVAKDKISHGSSLSDALGQTSLFPTYFASILAVGEEAGELGRVFQEIANRSREQFNQWVARMTTILEPVLILGMAIIVGAIVVVMMLSITATTDISI